MQEPLPGLAAASSRRPVTPVTPPTPPGALLVVPHGAAAIDALLDVIATRRADDPLAPVTVAVPSPLAGLALRRVLGARSGFVNVRFTALARVAELLGAPTLAAGGRRPLTPALRLESIHTALARDEGVLSPVSAHPATAAALAATFDDLGDLDASTRAELATRSERAATVVRLYDAFKALTADCYDVADVARAAAEAVRAGAPTAAEVGHVVLHLPLAITTAESELLAALAGRGGLTALLGRTGDDAVDRGLLGPLTARLEPLLGAPVTASAGAAVPRAHRVLSAPDPDDEVRAVARELDERARAGESLGRVAIVYRVPEPYARLVPEVLDAAGIPWTGAAPRRVADTAAGRILLGLLALADDDLARDDVAAWLAAGPVIDPADGRRVNATRWDVLSREAGVVAGAAQWADRLALRLEAIDAELAAGAGDAEASAWQVRHVRRDRDDTAALAAFVAGVARALTPPEPPSWHALARWAADLLTRYAGTEGQRHDWPEPEVEAARSITASVDELGALDAVAAAGVGPVDVARFRRTLEAELDARTERIGRFGAGVLVGQLGQAYGGDFDVVYVLGAIEGALPPRGREDPLLPDRERRGVTGLPQHATRRLEERRDYLTALAAAGGRVLSFPRADPRAQRKRLPARWVLESTRALAGRELTAEELRDLGAAPWLDVTESFEGLVHRGEPASATEYALRSLRAWHDAGKPLEDHPLAAGALARGYVAAAARAEWRGTPFDGLVGPSPQLAPSADRATSPTALQGWAECPFRYFLARVLRLSDVPRPETTEAISALDEGALVHAVLEEFVRDAPTPASPTTPWTEADRERMQEIVDRHCDEAEQRGITGRPIMWTLARRRIVATAQRFLRADEHVRAALGVVPAPDGLERGFGTGGSPPVEVELESGRVVRFRGRIDRVDRSPDGRRAVVYDYKTGRRRRYDTIVDDPVDGGRLLQLPVYALAARAQEGTDEAIAAYWFTSEPPDAPLLPVALDDAEDRFVEVVGTIVDGVASGCFPAYPGGRGWDPRAQREAWSSCWYCEFDRLCPVDRGVAWDRVADDEATAPFRALDLAVDEDDDAGDDR